ncbi:sugar-specific transcriptional regulator TrmB [Methanofollis fontis]|uniref:Sugar-specific transcriptional regulator TrmB n=1 Tax=Methanofollis fontis TaxID=2052832 RepID=A0A483CRT5_9EURY|nr:sugar-specific transcriptional regulator TrmB [Methanofollis fontis]TAJ43840.1 sugar-specific transcriptional regulator TrmB [Methanofollis fontis]
MPGVIERRRELLAEMRRWTLEKGSFSIPDLAESCSLPRSTVQDWVNRLLEEGCIVQKEERRGRHPATFVSKSALPVSACRRIFTTVDGDRVECYHECLSSGCAAYCEYHHGRAGGALIHVQRDGTLLRECGVIGAREIEIGLPPRPAVGVTAIRREGDEIVQTIRCVGGPAHSLTDQMGEAEGVCSVVTRRTDSIIEGEVRTRALSHIGIGIDDTDAPEGGATFALALALLQYLSTEPEVIPISHRVAMLKPDLPERTAGNSCSYIELAAEPGSIDAIWERAQRFLSSEALSSEWGIALREGFHILPELTAYGVRARTERIDISEAHTCARRAGILLCGGRGVIGALAAVALRGIPTTTLLDPYARIEGSRDL